MPPLPAARPLARMFLALAGVTWCLIAFGALVRAQKAGLACPDWPTCYGKMVPDAAMLQHVGTHYEVGHRALAGLVALIFTAGALLCARIPEVWRRVRPFVIVGGIVLIVQIVFGGLTVLIVHRDASGSRPATWTVATHLILGNTFAAVALLTGLRLRALGWGEAPLDGSAVPKLATILRRVWSLAMVGQFVVGGMVAGNIAGLVCTEFPACRGGQWFPSSDTLTVLHMAHRLNAYLLLAVALGLAWTTRHCGKLGLLTRGLALLVVAQAILGAVNIASYLHVAVTTGHSALAALLFSVTAVLELEFGRRKRSAS